MSTDLIVRDIRIDRSLAAGTTGQIEATIENAGNTFHFGSIGVTYRVNGTVVGTDTLPSGLSSVGTNNEDTFFTIPNTPGPFTVSVTVTDEGTVTETNTRNNTRTETFVATAPDLVVSDISFDGSLAVGGRVTVNADISNIGTADYTDGFDVIDVEYLVGGRVVATDTLPFGLTRGAVNRETASFIITEAGQIDVEVRLSGTAIELRTDNNSRTEGFVARAVAGPDVTVTDIDISGQSRVGELVTINAEVENIGTEGQDPFTLQYWVYDATSPGGRMVGTSQLPGGLPDAGNILGLPNTNSESDSYISATSGPQRVEVRIVNTTGDVNRANDNRSEYFGQLHNDRKTLANSAEEVRLAGFLAHTVYGDLKVPAALNGSPDDNGLDDNYRAYLSNNGMRLLDADDLVGYFEDDNTTRFQAGGLYEGRSSVISVWEAQALLARETLANGDTALVLGFRGTDPEDGVLAAVGQSYTGNGLYDHYSSLRPLVEAAIAYANDASNGIDAMIVGGHSLGGAMADMFASIDAQRLKGSIDLTTVAFGSPGVNTEAYVDNTIGQTDPLFFKQFRSQYDDAVVNVTSGLAVTGITTPAHHITISHTEDRVTDEDLDPNGENMVTSLTLNANTNFGGLLGLDLVNIGNQDQRDEGNTAPKGFGAEHNIGLYWANIEALTDDPLVNGFSGQTIVMGRANYASVGSYDGDPQAVFPRALVGSADDRDAAALFGTAGREWLLGLSGDDQLYGGGGNDLLSGGEGADYLGGGTGADRMAGGLGNDFYIVDNAGDRVVGEIAFSQGGGIDTVRTFIDNYMQPDNIELVRLGNINGTGNLSATGNDAPGTLVGNAGNNTLTGRGGDDQINGNDGNDVLIGNTGRDVLVGGAGSDRFIYSSVSESRAGSANRDIVNGLTHGVDRIDLRAVDAVQTSFGDDAFTFIGRAAFSDTAGELRIQGLGGPNAVLVEMDVTGDGVANMQIFVNLTTFMEAGDFLL